MGQGRVGIFKVLALLLGATAACLAVEGVLALLCAPPLRYRHPQPLHRPDLVLGWTLVPLQQSFTIDRPVRTNSLGLRSPEVERPKPVGVMRVVCMGDSQTFGNGVDQEATYAAVLERLLADGAGVDRIEVINAGIQGYDTLQEVALLERMVQDLEPDVVTLGFFLNDVGDALRADKVALVAPGTGEFRRRGIKRLTPYPLIYLVKRSRLVTFVRWRLLVLGDRSNPLNDVLRGVDPPQYEPAWRTIEDTLRRARVLAWERGFRLILFPVPVRPGLRPSPRERYRSRLLEIAGRLDIEACDPTVALAASEGDPERYFIPWDGHLSAEGHRLVADVLARAIRDGSSAGSAREGARR